MTEEPQRFLSPIKTNGYITADGKIRGLQATEPGDAVMLGDDGKIPSEFVGDLENYYTKDEVDQAIADAAPDLSVYYTKTEVDGLLDGLSAGMCRVQRLTVTGDGSRTDLTAEHTLGTVPAVSIYKDGAAYGTDMTVTESGITLHFNTAPEDGVKYTLVVIG